LTKLKYIKGKVAILRRIDRVKEGNFGDHKSIGGNKSTQSKDITKAQQLCKELDNE